MVFQKCTALLKRPDVKIKNILRSKILRTKDVACFEAHTEPLDKFNDANPVAFLLTYLFLCEIVWKSYKRVCMIDRVLCPSVRQALSKSTTSISRSQILYDLWQASSVPLFKGPFQVHLGIGVARFPWGDAEWNVQGIWWADYMEGSHMWVLLSITNIVQS